MSKTKQKEEVKVIKKSPVKKKSMQKSLRKNKTLKHDKPNRSEHKKTKGNEKSTIDKKIKQKDKDNSKKEKKIKEKSQKIKKVNITKKTIYKKVDKISPAKVNVEKKIVAKSIKIITETKTPKTDAKLNITILKATIESCTKIKIKPKISSSSFTKWKGKPKAVTEVIAIKPTSPQKSILSSNQSLTNFFATKKDKDFETKINDTILKSPEVFESKSTSTITLYKSIISAKASLSDFQAVGKVENLPRLPTKVVVIKKGVPAIRPIKEIKEKVRPFVVTEAMRPPRLLSH